MILPSVMFTAANAERPARDSSVTPLVALRQLAEFGGGTCAVSRLAPGAQVLRHAADERLALLPMRMALHEMSIALLTGCRGWLRDRP